MSAWPDDMKVGPIGEWPGQRTVNPTQSKFRSTLTATLQLLDRELYELADTRAHQQSAELLVAIPAGAFRIDGRPRADARATHPGVILSMDTRHGHLSYPCDTFTTWEDNLRAIALSLEKLRAVDRYGVTKRGEQYRGFLAIESTPDVSDTDAAWDLISETVGYPFAGSGETLRQYTRRALRAAHPDTGGSADLFRRVSVAIDVLRREVQI